jgi:tetratricopeptide (TPR) repeat protein
MYFVDGGDESRALQYLERARELARSANVAELEWLPVISNIGAVLVAMGRLSTSRECFSALKGKAVKLDAAEAASASVCLALIGRSLGSDSLELCLESLKACRDANAADLEAECLLLTALAYFDGGEMRPCVECLDQALHIVRRLRSTPRIAEFLFRIGVTFEHLGYDKRAIDYIEQSRILTEEVKDLRGLILCLEELGHMHLTNKKYAAGKEYFERALKIREREEISDGETKCREGLAQILLASGDPAGRRDPAPPPRRVCSILYSKW